MAASEVTGLDCFQVWAAPFDVMFGLIAARARSLQSRQSPTAQPGSRYGHLPPGVQTMIAKLQGRNR